MTPKKKPIEWTDVTWNPVRGCSRVSEGCRNCYAERMAARFSGTKSNPMGSVTKRDGGVFEGFAFLSPSGPRWTGKVELIEHKLEEPLHWRKPCKVFVNSMSDLFHEALPDEAIDRVFAVMALCPHLTFQVLTKREVRMREYMSARFGAGHCGDVINSQMSRWLQFPGDFPKGRSFQRYCEAWPLPNVWLGVSAEDDSQQQRIRELVKTPAAVRFISYEPALAPLNLQWALPRLDWVICGGESGPGARPFNLGWARSVRDQCRESGVPFFMKQLGSKSVAHIRDLDGPIHGGNGITVKVPITDRKGGNMLEWPIDLRIREFPLVSL